VLSTVSLALVILTAPSFSPRRIAIPAAQQRHSDHPTLSSRPSHAVIPTEVEGSQPATTRSFN